MCFDPVEHSDVDATNNTHCKRQQIGLSDQFACALLRSDCNDAVEDINAVAQNRTAYGATLIELVLRTPGERVDLLECTDVTCRDR